MVKFGPSTFILSTIDEGKKVIWPSREMVIRHTVMVAVTVAIAVVIFSGVDYVLQKLVILAIQ